MAGLLDLPVNRGLTGFWPLTANTIQAGLALDLSGNGNSGTLTGSPTITPGYGGQNTTLLFNGSTAYVRIPINAVDNPQQTGITYSAWIRPAALSNAYNAVMHNNNNAEEFFVKSSGKMGWFFGSNNADGSGIFTLSTGVWYLVTIAWNMVTGVVVGYVNGLLDATYNGGTTAPGASLIDIGADNFSGGRFFTGCIAGARIYGRALSAVEVYQLWTNPSPTFGLTRPRRQAFPAGSSGTVIFIDYAMPVSRSGLARVDSVAPLGASGTSRRDLILPAQFSGAIRADITAPLESLGSVRRDVLAPTATYGAVRIDRNIPIGTIGALRSDVSAPTAWGAAVRLDYVSPIGWGGTVRADFVVPVERRAAIRADELAPIEQRAVVSITDNAPVAWSGSVKGIMTDWAAPVRWSGAVRSDATPPAAFSASVRRDISGPLEALGLAARIVAAPVAWLGTAQSISTTIAVPVAWGASVSAAWPAGIEWLGYSAAASNFPLGWTGSGPAPPPIITAPPSRFRTTFASRQDRSVSAPRGNRTVIAPPR